MFFGTMISEVPRQLGKPPFLDVPNPMVIKLIIYHSRLKTANLAYWNYWIPWFFRCFQLKSHIKLVRYPHKKAWSGNTVLKNPKCDNWGSIPHFQTGPTNILVIYAYILSRNPILFLSCFGFYIFSHTFSQLFESLPWLIASSPQEMPEIIYPHLWKCYHVCWLNKVFFNQMNPSNMLIFVELCWLYIYNVFTTSISIHMGWVKTLGLYSHP